MTEHNDTENAPEPVDPSKSARNKIGVGIFLLVTLIAAMAFVHFATNLVKRPLGVSRDTEETSEVQGEARYLDVGEEYESTSLSALHSIHSRTSPSLPKLC